MLPVVLDFSLQTLLFMLGSRETLMSKEGPWPPAGLYVAPHMPVRALHGSGARAEESRQWQAGPLDEEAGSGDGEHCGAMVKLVAIEPGGSQEEAAAGEESRRRGSLASGGFGAPDVFPVWPNWTRR
jgi:hypothetical protein